MTQAAIEPPRAEGVRQGRWRRVRLVLVRATLALGAALALGELTIRYLLLDESELALRFGKGLRNPHLYADAQSEDDFWKLMQRFGGRRPARQYAVRDEQLGWLSASVLPGTYRHRVERWIGERRPVLMYGDSFTNCLTSSEDCWEGLMGRDPSLSSSHCLVNYGVCAFGFDQTYLLLRNSLDLWVERNPLVLVGVLVDDDLDRVVLGFRGCPKPLTRLEDGALAFDYPGTPDIDEWLEAHPLERGSYLLRYVAKQCRWWPRALSPAGRDEPELVARKSALARALVEAIDAEVASRGLELLFVLFHEPASAARPRLAGWRERLLVSTLDELGIRYVSSKRALRDDSERSGRPLADYFFPTGPEEGHLDALGNEVVYRAIARAVRGEAELVPGEGFELR